MYFFGFVEFLKINPSFKRLKIDDGLYLESWNESKKEVKFFRKHTKNNEKLKFPILVYKKAGVPTQDMGLYFASNKFESFALAVNLQTSKMCTVNVWFGLNDKKNEGLEFRKGEVEKMWLPIYRDFDNEIFTHKDQYSELSKVKFISNKFKITYRNIEANYKDWYGYSRLKNAIRYYKNFIKERAFVKIFGDAFVILESLFSDNTNPESISYKMALRISWFLYKHDATKRQETFNVLIDWYGVRSSILHGRDFEGHIQKKVGKNSHSFSYLIENSQKIKELVSLVLDKILSDNELVKIFDDEEKVPLYFKKLVLNS